MSSPNFSPPRDDPTLRDALRRCSPATYYAACKFRQGARPEDLRTVMQGVVERYVARELRSKLQGPAEALRLSEDLGIDSLTMMEIVMVAEEVLGISVSNDELPQMHTLAEVQGFLELKVYGPAALPAEERTAELSLPTAVQDGCSKRTGTAA